MPVTAADAAADLPPPSTREEVSENRLVLKERKDEVIVLEVRLVCLGR